MLPLQPLVHSYIHVCEFQKNLSNKTTRAYQTDLNQFFDSLGNATLSKTEIKKYIDVLHLRFKPKTVKRKIASLKAFFNYLVEEEILDDNPFCRLKVSYKEPIMLPKTIPMNTLQQILSAMYAALANPEMSKYRYRTLLLEICVLELLFATGMRVSELCNLGMDDIDLESKTVRILGKGSRERIMQIENTSVLCILQTYKQFNLSAIKECHYFFINRTGKRLSEQSVRNMLCTWTSRLMIPQHITPHMIRHTLLYPHRRLPSMLHSAVSGEKCTVMLSRT